VQKGKGLVNPKLVADSLTEKLMSWTKPFSKLEEHAMPRILTAATIRCPIGTVFDYVTTPANWPAWHPASRAVLGSADHSLLIGEQVTEEFIAGGRRGSCVWQVAQREVPHQWKITTVTPQIRAEITYRLTAQDENTMFERELTYATSSLWLWVLDFLLMRRRMARESHIALERLKEQLERPDARDKSELAARRS
jgi:uncharacterized protein YndB with AHSA1/START domain